MLALTALFLIVGGHVGLDALHPVVAEDHDDAPEERDPGVFVAPLADRPVVVDALPGLDDRGVEPGRGDRLLHGGEPREVAELGGQRGGEGLPDPGEARIDRELRALPGHRDELLPLGGVAPPHEGQPPGGGGERGHGGVAGADGRGAGFGHRQDRGGPFPVAEGVFGAAGAERPRGRRGRPPPEERRMGVSRDEGERPGVEERVAGEDPLERREADRGELPELGLGLRSLGDRELEVARLRAEPPEVEAGLPLLAEVAGEIGLGEPRGVLGVGLRLAEGVLPHRRQQRVRDDHLVAPRLEEGLGREVVDRCRLHDHRRLGPAQRVGLLLDPRHAGAVVKDLARPGQDGAVFAGKDEDGFAFGYVKGQTVSHIQSAPFPGALGGRPPPLGEA